MTDRSVIAYPAILHFSESRHYIREVSPANTMAYDTYSPPTMAAKRLNLPPVPSTVTSFTLSDAPLPTPAGWWRHPSSSQSLLIRDDNNGRKLHRCSCHCVVVVLVVMFVVVLLLSAIPSRRFCHRCRCHRQTSNAQRPLPSPRSPPLPLLSQLHLLQLSPPPSPHCRFHRRR